MRSRLNCLETSYSTNGELGLIKDIADSLWNAGFTAELIFDSGTRKHITDLNGLFQQKRFRVVFSREGCAYTFVFIKKDKHFQGCLIDADALTVSGSHSLGLTKSKKRDVDFRPYFDDASGRHKLHKEYMGVTDKDIQVDHITRRGAICIKEMLRVCTAEQNSRNKIPSENNINLQKKYFTLTGLIITDKDDITALESEGYKLVNRVNCNFTLEHESSTDRYNLVSPKFSSVKELYQELNRIENKYYGQYRYNPIYAFDDVEICGGVSFDGVIWTYLYMQVKLLGLNEDEFVALRKEFLKEHCPDMCDYYGVV